MSKGTQHVEHIKVTLFFVLILYFSLYGCLIFSKSLYFVIYLKNLYLLIDIKGFYCVIHLINDFCCVMISMQIAYQIIFIYFVRFYLISNFLYSYFFVLNYMRWNQIFCVKLQFYPWIFIL